MIDEKALARYCCGDPTEIENYAEALADTQTWECHHRLELTKDGKFAYSKEALIKKGWYYNRPISELIFLTESEHKKMHGKGRSDDTREKYSKVKKGIPLKHFDITVSQVDDPKVYHSEKYQKNKDEILAQKREYYQKNKDEIKAKTRERYLKKKALAANK